MKTLKSFTIALSCAASALIAAHADERAEFFKREVQPLLDAFCHDCHDSSKARADVNLERFSEASHLWRDPKVWERVLIQLDDKLMPPPKRKQPSDEERAKLANWLRDMLEKPDVPALPRDPGPSVIHRLSRLEYNNTIRDLLGVDTRPADAFPPDAGGGAGFDNNAATLFIPAVLMEKYLEAAKSIVAAAKPERLFAKRPGEGCDEGRAATESLEALAKRAYRRPLAVGEVDRLMKIYSAARTRGEDWESAVKLACKAILVSPHFLFRIEEERPGSAEPFRISDWELASRLSYFLWSSMPDAELFRVASEGKLHEPAELEKQVARMVDDPKGRTFAENFASQWLRTKEVRDLVEPAPKKFPQFTPELRNAFYEEPIEFFLAMIRENRSLTECVDSDYAYVNEILAKFYGIAGVTGPEMRRVALPDRTRGGVLGMGGVLTLTSYPRRTSPVLRGKWVLEEILGSPTPPPPPNVNTATVEHKKGNLTFRQSLEQHRENVACAGCHARMDPLGFGLENYDAIGAWRTKENNVDIDSSGQFASGATFVGVAEMKSLLMQNKDQFTRNVAEKMLAYALGRGLEPADWWPSRQVAVKAAADGYRARTLILEIAKSFPFQYRRPTPGPAVAQTSQP